MALGVRNSLIVIGAFFFLVSSFAEKAPYPSFAKDATSAAGEEYYDYIIIGGGAAGCALAATLSASAKVALLERGGLPYGNAGVEHMSGFLPTLLDTSPTSASQTFVSTDGVYSQRGRILGGGSAINLGFYSRADPEFLQAVGWDPRLVNESYEWVERKVAFEPQVKQWQAALRGGLLEAGVSPYRGFTYDHLEGTKIGGTIFDENGYRHTAADLLEYADNAKITVYLHATVHQILFTALPGERPNAYGVAFKDSKGGYHKAWLTNKSPSEIIVTAGALGSPQLLMLSGIGPAHHLKAHGINVILDQPMVGQGMSDNPMNAVLVPSPKPVETSLVQIVGISDGLGIYVEAGSGFLEPIRSVIPFSQSITQSGVIIEKVARPFSTGYLELNNKDPNHNPNVTFNYFQDQRDLQGCVRGMETIRKVFESEAFSAFRYPFTSFESLMELVLAIPNNLREKHLITGAHSMEQYCVDTVMSTWHYHGGCQVGRVVDRDYRVIGVESLRVIDGSTFYKNPGTNPQATVMMLGRYMGQKILQQRQQH